MGKDKFKTVVKALVTNHGDILVGEKEKDLDHPISGEWHLIEGYLRHGEEIEQAVKEKVKDQTGLEVDIHQTIDIMTNSHEKSLQILFHCVADSRNIEASKSLEEVKWVSPEDLEDHLDETELDRIKKRPAQAKFLEKIEKTPY